MTQTEHPRKTPRILLCVTGGIAAFKAVLLLRLMVKAGFSVRVVMTRSATRFVGPLTFEALSGHPVAHNLWKTGGPGGESHIRLTDEADAVVVVPATASTLARMAHGLASDLVSAVLLSARTPILVAPAMHTRMYEHPATQENLSMLRRRGVIIVEPVEGDLASGMGKGRMEEPDVLFEHLQRLLVPQDLAGLRVCISAGPTLEPLDPVRFISNHSSGKMGYALAQAAWRRGALVTLVSGPTALPCPTGAARISIQTAKELHQVMLEQHEQQDVVIMSAAVADFTPAAVHAEKVKKSDAALSLELVPTRDILAELGAARRAKGARHPLLVGFAMETEALERHAQAKVIRKGCDLIVANHLKEPGAGFRHDTNRVTFFWPDRAPHALPLLSKAAVSDHILDEVLHLLHTRIQEVPTHAG